MIIGMYDATYVVQSAQPQLVLNRVSLEVQAGQRIAIVAGPGSGKTTLAHILNGTRKLTAGSVIRHGSVSWPIGFTGAFHPYLTASENVRFIAEMYGLDVREIDVFCQQFSELGSKYFQPLSSFSSSERSRIGFALSFAIDFDVYLVDDMFASGDQAFRHRCEAALEACLKNRTLIAFSRNLRSLEDWCTDLLALCRGKLVPCSSVEEAAALLEICEAQQ